MLLGQHARQSTLATEIALQPGVIRFQHRRERTDGDDLLADFDQLIMTLKQTLGLTVFMVTHDLDSLFTVADRIAVLGEGKVIAAGPLSTMLAHDNAWIKSYFRGKRARHIPAKVE